jgi:hypothetical protein
VWVPVALASEVYEQSFAEALFSRLRRPLRDGHPMATTVTTEAPKTTKLGGYLWGVVLLAGLVGVVGLIMGVVRWLNPDAKVLASLALEGGAARTSIQLTEPCELRVLLNVKALREIEPGDLEDDLARSQLTLTASNPEATVQCTAYNGWSGSGSEERRTRVPRIKEAENRCSLRAASGPSLVTIKLDWKGKHEPPLVTALLVTP